MMDDDSQEQKQHDHYYMYPQMTTNHSTPTLAPSSLPPLMISSSSLIPQSYCMHYPSTPMTQPQQQPPPSLPTTSISTGYNTIRQHQQYSNPYYYNERNNEVVAIKSEANDSPIRLRSLQFEEKRTVGSGMTSTVTVNNSLSQRQHSSSNDETITSPTTSKQKNKVEKQQIETTVTDNKVVSVCKQTLTAAIQKVINDDYGSALHKLRKTIRILDILMFREGSSGIGSAKIETVRPWLDTLKDMEQRVSLKENNENNGSKIPRAEYSYLQVRKRKHYNSGNIANSRNTSMLYNTSISNGDDGGVTRCNFWLPNTKRYRITGKVIVEQPRRGGIKYTHCYRGKWHSKFG